MTGDVYHEVYVMHRAFSHDIRRGHIGVPKQYNIALYRNEFFFMQVKNKRKKKKEKPSHMYYFTQ